VTTVRLNALDGRLPLAFLTAVGTQRLLVLHASVAAELSWDPVDCTARLHSPLASVEEVVAHLRSVVESIPDDGVLPGVSPDFPPPGEAPDRLRLERQELRNYAEVNVEPGSEAEAWMSSLVTDLTLDDKQRADISQFTAPSGKQSMRTMLTKPLTFVRKRPEVLDEALTGWRRYADVTGEYLDHKVLFDAADASDGKSRERGVPGATWLALMSYPLIRTTADGTEPQSLGWQRVGRRPRLVYPLWEHPLDLYGVQALLSHPEMAEVRTEQSEVTPALRTMGVFRVCRAARRRVSGRNFAGVLAPLP
jgi:hypothetical protein